MLVIIELATKLDFTSLEQKYLGYWVGQRPFHYRTWSHKNM